MNDKYSFGALISAFFLVTAPYFAYWLFTSARAALHEAREGVPGREKRGRAREKAASCALLLVKRYVSLSVFFALAHLFLFQLYKLRTTYGALKYLASPFNWEPFNLKFVATATALNGVLLCAYTAFRKKIVITRKAAGAIPAAALFKMWLFTFFVCVILSFLAKYGIVTIEQLLFHVMFPTRGANWSMVTGLILAPLVNSGAPALFAAFLFSYEATVNGRVYVLPFKLFKKIAAVCAGAVSVAAIGAVIATAVYYARALNEPSSSFFEENYIPPRDVAIAFPEKKRNLIVIFVESLETGFLTKENGGAFDEDLLPHVTELARRNVNFSAGEGIGGVTQLNGAGWTVAGITSYLSGTPLAVSLINRGRGVNDYGKVFDRFLENGSGLGDILAAAGYKNYFFCGSDAAFGGRDKYFKTHKDAQIFDYLYFEEHGFIDKEYRTFWGVEDRKLYRFAKRIIPKIARGDENPFFIALLTVDTHPPGEFLDKQAAQIFDTPFKNVIYNADTMLFDFVSWIQKQDFYENTTVVILGDHLYMDSWMFPAGFHAQSAQTHRYPLNVFINSPLNPAQAKGRALSHFDMLPLLVQAVGGSFEGDGLALGRSLQTRTLLEKDGAEYLNKEIGRRSDYYNALWGRK